MGGAGGGMIPTLAQELANGNFHPENRESFHDYIYSKLLLGEEKTGVGPNPSSNIPVFPNSNLANSYPTQLSATTSAPNQNHPGHSIHAYTTTSASQSNNSYPTSTPAVAPVTPKQQQQQTSKNKKATIQQLTQQQLYQLQQQQQQMLSSQMSNQPQAHQSQSLPPENAEDNTKSKKKSHHKKKEKTNICDVCGRGFAEKYTLNRHMLTHSNVKPYSCTKCNMAFSRSDGLAKHMAAGHRRIDAHHCDVCGGTFNSEVSFEQHRREYGSTLPFVCNLCMLAFSQCCHLNYHMKSHNLNKLNDSGASDEKDEKSNPVDVSDLIPEDFSPPKSSASQQKDSLQAGLYNFSNAALKRTGNNSLVNPNITIKPEVEDINERGVHASETINQRNSSYFNALNSGNNPISLSTGGPGATSSENAASLPPQLHSLTSNPADLDMKKYFDIKIPNPRFMEGLGSPPGGAGSAGEDGLYHCHLCGKGFTRKYHMQRHVKLHTRGPIPRAHLLDWTRRPYACGVCKMGFTRQHHLTRHMLIHTGERPHACHVCGKAFRRFTNLSLHVRTVHGAERPFKCPVCGRGFPRLYSLQRHIKLHTKEIEAKAKDAGANTDTLAEFAKTLATVSQNQNTSKANRLSPGHSRDSMSSENSELERSLSYESSGQNMTREARERMNESINSTIRNNTVDTVYNPPVPQQNQVNKPPESRVPQQTMQLPNQTSVEVVNQHRSILGNDVSSRNHTLPRSAADYHPHNMSTASDQRYVHNLSAGNNYPEVDHSDTQGFSLNHQHQRPSHQQHQRHQIQQGVNDRYLVNPTRIQSPHPVMSNIERPVSRGLNQSSPHPIAAPHPSPSPHNITTPHSISTPHSSAASHPHPSPSPHQISAPHNSQNYNPFTAPKNRQEDRTTASPVVHRDPTPLSQRPELTHFSHGHMNDARVMDMRGIGTDLTSGNRAMMSQITNNSRVALEQLTSSSRAALERAMNAELSSSTRAALEHAIVEQLSSSSRAMLEQAFAAEFSNSTRVSLEQLTNRAALERAMNAELQGTNVIHPPAYTLPQTAGTTLPHTATGSLPHVQGMTLPHTAVTSLPHTAPSSAQFAALYQQPQPPPSPHHGNPGSSSSMQY